MAINRYDTPAETQFIDTYVPIPFEKLYALGKQAKDDVDKALADTSAAFKNWDDFKSLSEKDIQTWYNETTGKAMPLVNEMIKNPDLIKSAEGRMRLQSVINNVDRAKLATLRQSAENMNTYDKLTKELMTKGLYNPDWHYRDFSNYDSTRGIFNETPVAYMDYNTLSKPYYDQMKPGFIETRGGYDYIGNTMNDLEAVANAHLTDMINTPQGKMHIQSLMKQGLSRDEAVATFRQGIIDSNVDRIIRPTRIINEFAKMQEEFAARVRLKNAGKGDEETQTVVPTVYDQQSWSTAQSSDRYKATLNGGISFSSYFEDKEGLDAISTAAKEASEMVRNGTITKEDFLKINDKLSTKYKEQFEKVQNSYRQGVRDVFERRSGIGSMDNTAEVTRKSDKLFKAAEETLFDIAGDINEQIQQSLDVDSYKGAEFQRVINGTPMNLYSTDLNKFMLSSDYISKVAGVSSDALNVKYKDENGYEVDAVDKLRRRRALVTPTSKGIVDNIDGRNTYGVIYDVYVPVDYDKGTFYDSGNDEALVEALMKKWGDSVYVQDAGDKEGKNKQDYIHFTAIRKIPADFDATSFSHTGDKKEAGNTLSKDRESININSHQFK